MTNPVLANRYELQRQIGQKADRRTLLARDLQTQNLVILKVLSVEGDVEWDDLKLFERQIEILRHLSHPGIPAYLNHFEVNLRWGKGLALVETYIPGRSLEDYLQAGQIFDETEVRQLAQELLKILIYLHNQQPPVLHRDIKPSNILLGDSTQYETGQPFLIDFGSVKNYGVRDTTSFTVVGTYGYMPPEQFGGRTVFASDLYSLGMTLIALLTGTHPSSMQQQDYQAQLERRPLSRALVDWLKWLTAADLNRRPVSALQALQVLQQGPGTQRLEPTVQKPAGSKITVIKTADCLEIQIPGLLGQTKLKIDPQQVTLSSQVLGVKFNRPQVCDRNQFRQLEYVRNGGDEGKPRLILWMGTQKYELGDDHSLNPGEAEWLADELSCWLQVPVSQI